MADKPKYREMSTNELVAAMPKSKADKILKSRNPAMLDEGPVLKTGRPGRAKVTSGSYNKKEIEARRKVAKERAKASSRVKTDKGRYRDDKFEPVNYKASAFKRASDRKKAWHPSVYFSAPKYKGVTFEMVSESKDGGERVWRPSKDIGKGPLIKTKKDGTLFEGKPGKGWVAFGFADESTPR